jgi:hypothetical protein
VNRLRSGKKETKNTVRYQELVEKANHPIRNTLPQMVARERNDQHPSKNKAHFINLSRRGRFSTKGFPLPFFHKRK